MINFVTVCTVGSRPANQFSHILLGTGTCKYLVVVSLRRGEIKINEGLPSLSIRGDAGLVVKVLFEAKQLLQIQIIGQLSNLRS